MDDMITCQLDGAKCHSIRKHLKLHHPDVTIEEYKGRFPEAPLLSLSMKEHLQKTKALREKEGPTEEVESVHKHEEKAEVETSVDDKAHRKEKMAILFEIPESEAMSGAKKPVVLTQFSRLADDVIDHSALIPDINHAYKIFPPLMKRIALAMELNLNLYLWGHAGTGKTSSIEQFCARTNRPYVRVQHTASTEEEHIVGATRVNESGTYFEPGILALAVKHGHVYCADEYDYAPPEILAVYQAVLEGKPLVIKEAPPEWRKIEPHPNFRFVATGNTNGSGDETGNYAGTILGNSANYSRFAVTVKVNYMEKHFEMKVIESQTGISKKNSELLVDVAAKIRQQYEDRKMSSTIGPRELINAGAVGHAIADFKEGLALAYTNRLPAADADIVNGVAQRIFG